MLEVPPLPKFKPQPPPDSIGVEGMRRLDYTFPEAGPLQPEAVSTRADDNGNVHPFKGIDASTGVAKVKFLYGTVGNFSPTFGGNPVFPESDEVTVNDGDKVYLDATVDAAGNITDLVAWRTPTVPADSPSTGHYYKLLFVVEVTGAAVTSIGQSVTSNLTLFICNGNAIWDRA